MPSNLKKYIKLLKKDKERKFVVPSAPGKRFKEDTKVTDLLYKAYRAQNKSEFNATLKKSKKDIKILLMG